ncbi:MAG TPA: aminoglycoside phosphotransferase [Jatrophihabitans sp.]|jgi:maltokinase|uniref:maltokinase N-terminal cap-like domain-containing protein n=1 Tax=Jatrophihabitans sp. TaxID=1932789 RepID=UPI002EEACC82
MRVDTAEVTRVLREWMGRQRWFAGKSRASTIEARLLATLTDQPYPVQIWLADVSYAEGIEHYQVPLVMRAEAVEQLSHAFVGSVADADGGPPIELYDALHDKEVTGLWLRAMAEESTVDGVSFVRVADPGEIPVSEPSLALTSEQSNTSLVFGDAAIMKVFRRLEAGLNPDIEIHAALGKLGGRHVAKLMGYVSAELDSQTWSLAMLQEYMTTASDGWQLATSSVRDLMAEADLHAEEAGGDFAAEAHRLGISTAEVHADLATAFGATVLDKADLTDRAAAMNARLTAALVEVPELAEVADGLREAYTEFAELPGKVPAQRVHGDLHLGQVLRTAHRWVILDFEGEPAKSISDRQAHDSPIRDVAGMLRSFDYAARHQLIDMGSTPQSEFRAAEWAERNRAAFCAGYAEGGGQDPKEAAVLLRAFEADKAVYESVYEARNRPNWLPIPLASLHRLAGTP